MAPSETETDQSQEQEKLPAYTNHDGFLLPKGFPIDGFQSGLRWATRRKLNTSVCFSTVHTHQWTWIYIVVVHFYKIILLDGGDFILFKVFSDAHVHMSHFTYQHYSSVIKLKIMIYSLWLIQRWVVFSDVHLNLCCICIQSRLTYFTHNAPYSPSLH